MPSKMFIIQVIQADKHHLYESYVMNVHIYCTLVINRDVETPLDSWHRQLRTDSKFRP
jgi:hypothetical protein